jgi:hypothetical protein
MGYVRFAVLMEVTMKNTVFWDMTPCSLVDVYRKAAFLPDVDKLHGVTSQKKI